MTLHTSNKSTIITLFSRTEGSAFDALGSMMRYALSTALSIFALPQLRLRCPTTRNSLICLENAEGRLEEALSAPKRYSNECKLLFTQRCSVA